MRVLTISNCPLNESQGSGYIILNYVRGLRRREHIVDLFGPESCEPFPRLQKARSHRLSLGMVVRSVIQLLRYKYDVVECYGGESWLAVSLLSMLPGRRFLIVSHSNGIETHFNRTLRSHFGADTLDGQPRKWYQRLFLPPIARAFSSADGLVTVSQFDARFAVSEQYQPTDRVLVLENPIPDAFLNQTVEFERPMVLGFCGSWLPNKGIHTICLDVTRLLQEFRALRFKIVGVGRDFCLDLHFPPDVHGQIEVIPFLEDKEKLRRIYHGISILLVPSVYESFGLVAAEGMACGCAVVATKTGLASDLRHGQEVILMSEPRSPWLYEAVKVLLLDESKRISVAKAGYSRVQSLHWDNAVDALSKTYIEWRRNLVSCQGRQ